MVLMWHSSVFSFRRTSNFGEVPGEHDYFGCFNGAIFVFVENTIATGVVGGSMAAAEGTLAVVLRASFRFVCRLLLGGGARQILLGVVPLAGHCTPATASFQLVLGRRVARCCSIGCGPDDIATALHESARSRRIRGGGSTTYRQDQNKRRRQRHGNIKRVE